MKCQINIATTTSTPRTIDEIDGDARIPTHEQDLDLGREGLQGLARNGLGPPVEEYVHYH
jgi:hypothetical protein